MALGKWKFIFGLVLFCVIAYCSYLLILLSLPYIHFERGVEFLATKELIYHIDWWRYSFYIHVFSSPVVILSGLLQFNHYLIHQQKKTHRYLGITYILFVIFISGPTAFLMGLYANGGYLAQVSFVLLSACWIGFTIIAYLKVKQHNFESHSKWMLRSYALTLSAITLRFYAYIFDVWNVPIPPKETYILLAYLSWIPNLVVVELILRTNYLTNLLQARS